MNDLRTDQELDVERLARALVGPLEDALGYAPWDEQKPDGWRWTSLAADIAAAYGASPDTERPAVDTMVSASTDTGQTTRRADTGELADFVLNGIGWLEGTDPTHSAMSREDYDRLMELAEAEAQTDTGELARLREAAQAALDAWTRMPDAGLDDGDPRRAWWFDTAPQREALRAALVQHTE